tara:strand:- start:374 stop:871 length:498 start_codon:yes stop_codon:yes gene_type:complete
MNDDRYKWSHRIMLKDGLNLTCACNGSIEDMIRKEVHYLEKLKKYKYFPKLYKYDIYQQFIIMDFCYFTLDDLKNKRKIDIPNNYKEQLKEISDIFIKENIYHSDLNLANICIRHGIITIIDFGCVQRLSILNKNKNFKIKYKSNFEELNSIFRDYISNNQIKLV